MNKKYLIDTSAFIMAIYQENSDIDFKKYFDHSVMHHMNVSEAIAVLIRDGMPLNLAEEVIQSTISETITTNFEEASLAACIRVENKQFGISTGDSFCLAAAKLLNYPIITADKIWTELKLDIEIICVR